MTNNIVNSTEVYMGLQIDDHISLYTHYGIRKDGSNGCLERIFVDDESGAYGYSDTGSLLDAHDAMVKNFKVHPQVDEKTFSNIEHTFIISEETFNTIKKEYIK